jgi:type IV fimbrial biogenesis protein FimT
MQMINKQNGFTLYELLIAMAIFGILAGVGIPGYINYVRNAELSNASSTILGDIFLARSEAIKTKTPVALCRTADVNAASPTCDNSDSIWTGGWLVFIDNDNDGVYDQADGETLLKVGSPPSTHIQIKANANAANYISFNADGSLHVNKITSIYSICDDRDGDGNYDQEGSRRISIGAIGKPEVAVSKSGFDCDSPS